MTHDEWQKLRGCEGYPRVRLTGSMDGIFGPESDELILVGDAVTTANRFERWEISLCHIADDGRIERYRQQIGDISEMVLLYVIEDTWPWGEEYAS